MVEAGQAYRNTKQTLHEAGIPDAGFEADVLFCHIAGKRHLEVAAITPQQAQALSTLAQKRATHYPLQYLVGSWPFLDLELAVGPGVLIPRPETEEVCLKALEQLVGIEAPQVLDLCAGTGALALGIQSRKPHAAVTAVEWEEAAFGYLRENCLRFAKTGKAAPFAVRGDALCFYGQLSEHSIDLIVSNPPYVTEGEYAALEPELAYEPRSALVAGENGLLFYRVIAAEYRAALRPGGCLVFEIGTAQGEEVRHILQKNGYTHIEVYPDYAGHARIALGRA